MDQEDVGTGQDELPQGVLWLMACLRGLTPNPLGRSADFLEDLVRALIRSQDGRYIDQTLIALHTKFGCSMGLVWQDG